MHVLSTYFAVLTILVHIFLIDTNRASYDNWLFLVRCVRDENEAWHHVCVTPSIGEMRLDNEVQKSPVYFSAE